ncbi:hypothetical protein ILUMI_25950 [Ignelater luminosus]|uniref:Uncharacterized protein n=1 Tax=Ignelater luminosus TaxID=2038154 RepID=A0A8K0C4V5_IGNLU|nr:hypothetical protein ILUMI_25950 [Ignelater luminosus]
MFELWRSRSDETHSQAGSNATINLLHQFICSKIEHVLDNMELEKTLANRIKEFCSTLDKKWKAASRSRSKSIDTNRSWMERNFNMPVRISTPTERTQEPEPSTSGVVLRDGGKEVAEDLVTQATEYSPKRAVRIRKLYRESSKAQRIISYTEEESLALVIGCRMSKDAYKKMRMGSKHHNAPNLYLSYDGIIAAKKRYLPEIEVNEYGASVPLQNLLNHTVMRLIQSNELPDDGNPSFSKIDLICKYGCNGSSGHSEYMQLPKTEDHIRDDGSDTKIGTDSNLFLFSLIPLRLVAITDESTNTINLKRLPIAEDNLRYGLSTLHAWIKCLECILHVAYKLVLQTPTIRGATKEQLDQLAVRKKDIQNRVWRELDIKVDKVVQGRGTSNTGNVGRLFLKTAKRLPK